MRLVSFRKDGVQSAGVGLADGGVVDLRALGDPSCADVLGLIQSGETAWNRARALVAAAPPREWVWQLSDLELLAPIPLPRKNIFCVGRNYLGHVQEGYRARGLALDVPKAPQFFSKPPTTVVGPTAPIRIDPQVSSNIDYEVELGVVMGRTGRDISVDHAMEHVFGFTVINDITARDLQRKHDQWFKGKGLDGSCPMGPWVVERADVPDLASLKLELFVNGEARQSAAVSQMIFDLPTIIAELSKGMTLEAGDIIATGTPEGVGYAMSPPHFLKDGDQVRCRIVGVGELNNRVETVSRRPG